MQQPTVSELIGTQNNNQHTKFSPPQLQTGENSLLVTLNDLFLGLPKKKQQIVNGNSVIKGYKDFLDVSRCNLSMAVEIIKPCLSKTKQQALSSALPSSECPESLLRASAKPDRRARPDRVGCVGLNATVGSDPTRPDPTRPDPTRPARPSGQTRP